MTETRNCDSPTTQLPRRGPKPLGDRPMTAAERQRRSRAKLVAEGEAEFSVRLRKGTLNLVDQLAKANGKSRSQVMTALLEMALAKVALAAAEADQLKASGASEVEIAARLRKHVGAEPPAELIEKFKEARGL